MSWWLVSMAVLASVYATFALVLVALGRRDAARALAGLIPDCLLLLRRLAADGRVARRHKLMLGALVGYLALPFDLVPDVIPVAGQLDDAIVVGLALRVILRAGGPGLVREHWPGPQSSLALVLRLSGGQ